MDINYVYPHKDFEKEDPNEHCKDPYEQWPMICMYVINAPINTNPADNKATRGA